MRLLTVIRAIPAIIYREPRWFGLAFGICLVGSLGYMAPTTLPFLNPKWWHYSSLIPQLVGIIAFTILFCIAVSFALAFSFTGLVVLYQEDHRR